MRGLIVHVGGRSVFSDFGGDVPTTANGGQPALRRSQPCKKGALCTWAFGAAVNQIGLPLRAGLHTGEIEEVATLVVSPFTQRLA
ncbi:MAG TPA: hypothetical protein VIJ35_11170 [Bradyrhizobium sp.]